MYDLRPPRNDIETGGSIALRGVNASCFPNVRTAVFRWRKILQNATVAFFFLLLFDN
jgi:hypothetical protein